MELNISVSANVGSVPGFRYFVPRLTVMYVTIFYFYIITNLKMNSSSKVLQNYTDSAIKQWYFSYRRFK
jgi:hypothetical protein